MSLSEVAALATAGITACSVIAMCFQIRSNIKLNRLNETFKRIDELDKILYSNNPLTKSISTVALTEDDFNAIEIKKAEKIFNKNKNQVYELLNFFESLSSAAFAKNIDKKILEQIYGPRIYKAYIKLSPFIILIAHKNSKDPNKRPYQHFESLYNEIKMKSSKKERKRNK
ncbi:MAG: hypothetical protein NC548_50680 [Lachnospiraceae bacterium]|nr:hypothetical protein [Lachnospiraceae bacterium]